MRRHPVRKLPHLGIHVDFRPDAPAVDQPVDDLGHPRDIVGHFRLGQRRLHQPAVGPVAFAIHGEDALAEACLGRAVRAAHHLTAGSEEVGPPQDSPIEAATDGKEEPRSAALERQRIAECTDRPEDALGLGEEAHRIAHIAHIPGPGANAEDLSDGGR